MLLAVHLHEIKGFHDLEQWGNIENTVLQPSPWNNGTVVFFSEVSGSSFTACPQPNFVDFYSLQKYTITMASAN